MALLSYFLIIAELASFTPGPEKSKGMGNKYSLDKKCSQCTFDRLGNAFVHTSGSSFSKLANAVYALSRSYYLLLFLGTA